MLSVFRELTLDELDLVSGGVDGSEDIIVVGSRFYQIGDPAARNDIGYDPSAGGEGTGQNLVPEKTAGVEILQHQSHCSSASGAAVQAAKHMMGTSGFQELGAKDGHTYNGGAPSTLGGIEFSAVIVDNLNGTYGTQHGQIWTEDKQGGSFVPDGFYGNTVGIWHNHPYRGDSAVNGDCYPSPDDWTQLANVYSSWSTQKGADWDPSLWLTGPDGVTREFKHSEEAHFRAMSLPDMNNGKDLAGHERTNSCGAN